MKATIILLIYNQECTIRRALESILHQECSYPYEILVADDASSDDTRAICEEYVTRYPEIVRMMPTLPNRGIVGNYFDAFEAAKGDYIADCAGDDEWLDPSRLQRSIEILDANPELSVVFTDVEMQCEGETTLASAQPERGKWMKKERIAGAEILRGVMNHTTALPYILSSALYRKSSIAKQYAANRNTIRNEKCGVEDVPLIAALANSGDAAYLPIKGYRYYIDGESASNNLSHEKNYRFYSRILTLIGELREYYNLPFKDCKEFFRSKTIYLASQARLGHRSDLSADLKQRARLWQHPLPLKARLHLLLT